jgi:hypothetical protein
MSRGCKLSSFEIAAQNGVKRRALSFLIDSHQIDYPVTCSRQYVRATSAEFDINSKRSKLRLVESSVLVVALPC